MPLGEPGTSQRVLGRAQQFDAEQLVQRHATASSGASCGTQQLIQDCPQGGLGVVGHDEDQQSESFCGHQWNVAVGTVARCLVRATLTVRTNRITRSADLLFSLLATPDRLQALGMQRCNRWRTHGWKDIW